MKTSDAINELAEALAKAQGKMKHALKESNNPAFNSKYADLVAVWDVARGPLSENGLCIVQMPVHSEDGRLHLTTRLAHKSGQWIEETMSVPVAKDNAHGYGSGITYCKRFALSAAVGIVADADDDGNEASNGATQGAKKPAFDRKHTPMAETEDQFVKLAVDQQQWYRDEADAIMLCFREGKNLHSHIEDRRYSDEDKLYLWLLLPSDCRSAIKKSQLAARSLAEQA